MSKNNLLKKACFIFGDSVLIYTVLLITSAMYYYRNSLVFVWAISSLLAVRVLFLIFDYISRHKIIGSLIYISIFTASMYLMGLFIRKGEENYPINFLLWFITTQDALEYNRWYTLTVFVFVVMFFASVVYYFTKVQYRLSTSFLVFIIPFVIYGKESVQMPSVFTVLLCMTFIVNIIRFSTERSGKAEIVKKKSVYCVMAVYVLAVGLFSTAIPKIPVKADRTYLESLLNMDAFTDMLISKINVFNNDTDGGKFNSLTTNDHVIFYAQADEPLRLKTQVFSNYDYEKDKWYIKEDFDGQESIYGVVNPYDLLNIIVLCSELDRDFAKKYNIDSGLLPQEIETELKTLTLYPAGRYSFEMLPVPTLLDYVDCSESEKAETDRNTKVVRSLDGSFDSSYKYEIGYYSDSIIYNPNVKKIISGLSFSKSGAELYDDMCDVLEDYDGTEWLTAFSASFDAEYASELLDYGDNQKIYELAQEITQGLESDFDKAIALERWFYSNDYIYDLTYRKSDGENVETFLFETHRGVCYEYATAMVLLSRACGIPARYAEGYSMTEIWNGERKNENSPDYSIYIRDAHGFPELWIQGLGWISFEPTVSDEIINYEKTDISKGLYISVTILAVIAVFGLLLIKFYPALYNRFFLFKVGRANPERAVSLIFVRIRSLYGMGGDVTAEELHKYLSFMYKTDISLLKNLFEKSVYGQILPNENDKKEVVELYKEIYRKFMENEKSVKKYGG